MIPDTTAVVVSIAGRYRTLPGDVFRDPQTGEIRECVWVRRAEDLPRMQLSDRNYYRHRPSETTSLIAVGVYAHRTARRGACA